MPSKFKRNVNPSSSFSSPVNAVALYIPEELKKSSTGLGMVVKTPSISDDGSETMLIKSPLGPRITTKTDWFPSSSTPTIVKLSSSV